MKRTKQNNRGWGALLASALTCLGAVSALGALTPPAAGPIGIPDFPQLPAQYPSTIKVENAVGVLDKVTVTLNTVTHSYANDLKVMLVAPNGKAIVLMSGAGGGQPLSGVTLTFDDTKGSDLPRFSQIPTGVYKPVNYAGATFAAPAPIPDATTLAQLATIPNGDWKLYVADDAAYNAGAIGSWSISLYTKPTIVLSATTLTIEEGKSGSINVTVADSGSDLSRLTVTATAANKGLIPNSGLVVTGTGGTRTLNVTPGPLQFGSTVVTVTVTDEDGLSTTATFDVNVTSVNQPPTLALSANSINVVAGEVSTALTAFLTDQDSSPSSITLSATASTDATVVSTGGLNFLTSPPNARPFTVIGNKAGSSTVTITAVDGTETATQTLLVNVTPALNPLFGNYTGFDLLPVAPATSVTSPKINITELGANIGKIAVALNSVRNINAGSKVTLKTPHGDFVLLNSAPAARALIGQLNFADGETGVFPAADTAGRVSLAPATSLASLAGKSAVGEWSLLVESATGTARIADGWQIKIFTAPTIGTIANVTFDEDKTGQALFTVNDLDGTVTKIEASIDASAPAVITSATVDGGKNAQVTLEGKPNQFGGPATVTVTAYDNLNQTTTKTFTVTVAAVNDAPDIAFIEKQITYAMQPIGPINFSVIDVDGDTVQVTARTIDGVKVLPDSNIIIGRDGADWTFTLFPITLVEGQATVEISATDGNGGTDTQTFTLYVQGPANALYNNATPIVINTGVKATPYPSTINVTSGEGKVAEVEVTLLNFTHEAPQNVKALLVGPNGNSVVLMGNVGGETKASNLTLVFSDSATAQIPAGSIASGIYDPSSSGVITFPDAPAATVTPTHTTLAAAFNNISPKGEWRLYVIDTGTAKSFGDIGGGWALSIRTAPFLDLAESYEMDENSTKRIPIVVGDAQPGVAIDVEAVAADTTLIQSIEVQGTGGTRTLVINNRPYHSGTTTITVTAEDDLGNTASDTFTLVVKRVNLDPVIDQVANVTTPAAEAVGPISFTVWSPQADTDPLVKIDVTSSNPTLFPQGSIVVGGPVITPVNLLPGTTQKFTGGENEYTLTLQPAGIQTGFADITVTATDITKRTKQMTFRVTVTPAAVYAFEKQIYIPLGLPIAGEATPYGAPITVSGLEGLVNKVRVTLVGFKHTYPEDVSVLLVSPDNQAAVMLMSHVGGGTDVSGVRFAFDDTATETLDGDPLVSGTYKPSKLGAAVTLPAPAPQITYGTTLAAFRNNNPNGDWKVYVLDEAFPDEGAIEGGVLLSIETKPQIKIPGDVVSTENQTWAYGFSINNSSVTPENLKVYARVLSQDPAGLVAVQDIAAGQALVLTNVTGTGTSRTLWITNAPNQPSATFTTDKDGVATIEITVTNAAVAGGVVSTAQFKYTVDFVNQYPVFTQLPTDGKVEIDEDVTGMVTIKFKDVDSVVSDKPTVSFTPNDVFPANSITVEPYTSTPRNTEGTVIVKLVPVANKSGTVAVTLSVKDAGPGGSKTTNTTFTVTVKPVNDPPTFTTTPAAIDLLAGSTSAAVAFKIDSKDRPPGELEVTATSNNGFIPNDPAYIKLGGSGADRTIQVTSVGTANGTVPVTVTITVKDLVSGQTATAPFTVNIKPQANTPASGTQFTEIPNPPLEVNGDAKAPVYPSFLTVSGLNGLVWKVTAMLDGLTHNNPANLDLELVHPDGTTATMLMSGAGDAAPVNTPIRLTFSDTAAQDVPFDALVQGTFKPRSYTKRQLPDAPVTDAQSLSVFSNKVANGQWRLYIDNQGGQGKILSGWRLFITTAPTIGLNSTTDITLDERSTENLPASRGTLTVTIADDYGTAASGFTVTPETTNPTLLPVRAMTTANAGNLVQTWSLLPELYQNSVNTGGDALIRFKVTRNSDGAFAYTPQVRVKVTPVNFAPTFSRIPDLTIKANQTGTIEFLVTDGDTKLEDLSIEAISENETIVKNVKLLFSGKFNPLVGLPATAVPWVSRLSLSIVPEITGVGTTKVKFVVKEKGTVVSDGIGFFWLTVEEYKVPPVISTIPNQTIASGGVVDLIPFTVTSPLSGQTFTVTGVDSPDYLTAIDATVNPSDATKWTLRLQAADIITDETPRTATVTLTATASNGGVATTTFSVIITPKRERTYVNSTPITIIDNAAANPYPSQIKVDDLIGAVKEVKVRLNGFKHNYPSDVGVLLVSPSGQKVVLMNRAGQGGGAVNTPIDLTFSQNAASPIPNAATLTAGTWRPADYRTGSYDFMAPAPTGPYTTTLAGLTGSAAGTWQLYVMDDVRTDAGAIEGGWSLLITTEPIIKGLQDRVVLEGTTDEQAFTIADDTRTATPTYQLRGSSSKPAVIPDAAITFGGSGTNRTVKVTPAASGDDVVITVFVTNGDGQTVQDDFLVDVTYNQTPPTIAAIADAEINAGSVLVTALNIQDAHTPAGELKIGITSSNLALVPLSNIKRTGNSLSVAPVGDLTGTTMITISVTNNDSLYVQEAFLLTVIPSPVPLFASTTAISIPAVGKAAPYPSSLTVPDLGGNIARATVTLNGFGHTFPQDVSILLASPSGTNVVLLSRAGGALPVTNVRLTFDDAAAQPVSQAGQLTDGIYRPSDYKVSDSYQSPAPIGPYSKELSDLIGTDPEGTWSLYVQDDATPDVGTISGGWTLTLTTTAGKAIVVGGRQVNLVINQRGNDVQLTVNGTPGVEYGIETSTDMLNWAEVGTVTAGDNGAAVYTVAPAKSGLQLFRAVAK